MDDAHPTALVYAVPVAKQGKKSKKAENWVQVSRQGNPLFNEALVAIAEKDVYSRTSPGSDPTLFRRYAESP